MDVERDRVTCEIIDELAARYQGVFDTEQIAAVVNSTWDLLADRSTINSYLRILVTRRAREQLTTLTRPQERIAR